MVGLFSVLFLGCNNQGDNSLAGDSDRLEIGIAHVAGHYGYVEGSNFITA